MVMDMPTGLKRLRTLVRFVILSNRAELKRTSQLYLDQLFI